MSEAHGDIFRDEAFELLVELEECLLELKVSPLDHDLVDRIFRAMHTIKGSSGMFGFDAVAEFTHHIETVFDLVRVERIDVTNNLVELTLAACDEIRAMVEHSEGGDSDQEARLAGLTAAFREMIPAGSGTTESKDIGATQAPESGGASPLPEVTCRIRFKPEEAIFSFGANPTLLLRELRELGPCVVSAQTDNIPALPDLEAESCYVFWDIVLTTTEGIDAVRDVFIFVEDRCELSIDIIDRPGEATDDDEEPRTYKRLGEILAERGDVSPGEIERVTEHQKKIGELLVEQRLVASDRVSSALAEQEHVRNILEKRSGPAESATIRVPAERLDRLVNMVGELVTIQSRLSQLSAHIGDADLELVAEEVEHLTAELRDNTMSIRMLPIGNTFAKFKRLVHDLSLELGKETTLVTEGGETELDKTVIEKLNDPLVHLIRNSMDHGIERPEDRRARGKPAAGTIRLSAEHSGANVLISISDDGAGIDIDTVRRGAIAKGLLAEDEEVSEKDVLATIFTAGLSTAKAVTNVSGRGVGLDVVKRSLETLGGAFDISSVYGEGTTITLKLPLTLAIIDGLLVRVEGTFFVLPLSTIEECVELTRQDIEDMHGKQLLHIRDELVPYLSIREQFSIKGEPPLIEQVIIVGSNGDRMGLVVDEVIGEHQTVIKSLGKFHEQVTDVSGATILGDGTVALIIDINQFTRKVVEQSDA